MPQIVGLYLVGCWGVVEFTDWAVEQYVLSPHVTNFIVILLISLLPSVILLAWRFGAPGDDNWTRTESIAIPLNMVVAAAILFFTFTGKDLGAATTTLVVEDETGTAIEREIPKQEFRKSVAVFYFDNESGDQSLDWMSPGVTLALQTDLGQQLFVMTRSPLTTGGWRGMMLELQEAGFADGTGVPLALKREIADERQLDFFVSGSFSRDESGLTLVSELYDTKRGRLLNERTFTGDDFFELVDQMSEQLRRDLDVPEYKMDEYPDLPVSELLTTAQPAFEAAARAMHRVVSGQAEAALPLLDQAVAVDSTFAFAQAQRSILLLLSNRQPEALAAMQAAMQHLYRLPERAQLNLRSINQWLYEQDADKALNTARYWTELYPDDIDAHLQLAELFEARGDRQEQMAEYEVILQIDPSQTAFIQSVGWLHARNGDYEQALEEFERYADLEPDDYEAYTAIATAQRGMGNHAAARAAYERAMIVEPDEPNTLIGLARLEISLGDFEAASRYRDEALAASRSAQDRYAVYGLDETLHHRQGQFRALEEDYQRRGEAAAEYMDPINRLINLANSVAIVRSPEAGRAASALRELDRLSGQTSAPFDGIFAIAYIQIYYQLEDVEKTGEQVNRLNATIDALGFEAWRSVTQLGLGRIAEIEGDCEEAIANYNKHLEISPGSHSARVWVARCQLALGEPAAAETSLRQVLNQTPAFPPALVQLALVYEATGRREDAIEQLEAATEIWKNADPEYIPAQQARRKLAELQATA